MRTYQEMENDFSLVQERVAQGQDITPWSYLLGNAASEGRDDICDFLLRHGVDGHEAFAWIPHYSALPNQLDLLRIFYSHGVRVALENPEDGETSVHRAAQLGEIEVLRYLVEEADGKSAFNRLSVPLLWTPLHCAVHEGHLDCARYLLERGANPNAVAYLLTDNGVGDTVLDEAQDNGPMIALLLEYGADPDLPGWMWNSARSRRPDHPLLAIPPLDSPQSSQHRAEIERQLLENAPCGSSIDWKTSRPAGPVVQLRGVPLQAADQVRILDPRGRTLVCGQFRFLILTGEQQLRAFWMEQEGRIPGAIWDALSHEQRFFVESDARNRPFNRYANPTWIPL